MSAPQHQPARRLSWRQSFGRGLRPPPGWDVAEWADRRRKLSPKGAAQPGQWDTDRAPYQREVMECLSDDHPCETVVFMASAQVGKTEILLNWAGYTIDLRPSPMMLVLPTVGIAEDFSKQRVSGLVTDTPSIAAKMGGRRGRSASNTILNKEFPGGMLLLRGANSAAGLRSTPVQKLAMDEVDGYPSDVDGEGDPVKLAEARARTFARRKFFYCSTPTIKGQSRIEEAYEETDRRRYFVPCPHCGCGQTLKFSQLKWPKDEPENVAYECDACEELIDESEKTWMLSEGAWHSTSTDGQPGKIGFHINALYSPAGWFSWAEIASEFLASKKSPMRLRTFVNTVLGETWEISGEKPDWEKLYSRRESYRRGLVPRGGLLLTAGVDVQGDRLECEVVAWGPDQESWSIDFRVLVGDPSQEDVWDQLDEVLHTDWPHESGGSLKISRMAIDEGFSTNSVRRFVGKYMPTKVVTVKGKASQVTSISAPKPVGLTGRGKKIKSGATLYTVGVNILKEELYGWLRSPLPSDEDEDVVYPRGWCHFPQYDQEYFKQLTAEEMVVKTVNGRLAYAWQKHRDRNEALDCRVYARAAAIMEQVDRWTDARWNAIRDSLSAPKAAPKKNEERFKDSDRANSGRRKGGSF